MDKKLQEHIEELLRLYDEARTTDEQERELAEFFRQTDEVPEAWKGHAQLFTTFAESDSLFTEAELDELLPHRRPIRPLWPCMLGAAATVALLIALFLHQPQRESTMGVEYLALTEQASNFSDMNITAVDSALMGSIAKLEIVPNSAHLDTNDAMRLGGDCHQPTKKIHDSTKIVYMGKKKDVMVAEAEPKAETASAISPSSEVRIGQTQVKRIAPKLTFTTLTLDVNKVFTPKDSSLLQFTNGLNNNLNTTKARVESSMRLGGSAKVNPAYIVLVNGESRPDSTDFHVDILINLTPNEVREYFQSHREYFQSHREVFEDYDFWVTKDDSAVKALKKKYNNIPKDKNAIVELRIRTSPIKADEQDSLSVK